MKQGRERKIYDENSVVESAKYKKRLEDTSGILRSRRNKDELLRVHMHIHADYYR